MTRVRVLRAAAHECPLPTPDGIGQVVECDDCRRRWTSRRRYVGAREEFWWVRRFWPWPRSSA